MNELIVKKIKEARTERELTQKDLANHLGKTAAAISDLERGKVQVSASDLYRISQLLNKPIEYFYGEDIGDKEIQDFVAVLRKQTPEARSGSLTLTSMMLQMQSIAEDMEEMPEDAEFPVDKAKEFYNIFVPFSQAINAMSKQLTELQQNFDEEFKVRGIDISNKKDG